VRRTAASRERDQPPESVTTGPHPWRAQARPATLRSHLEESTMNFQPLADRLLVRRIEEQETVRGGIIIPDTAKEKPQEGEVVAVGPGRLTEDGKRVAPEVKKGDRILVGKYSGTDVKIDGTEYVILREDEVLGVLSSTKSSK
jgi:chaperonin GroES